MSRLAERVRDVLLELLPWYDRDREKARQVRTAEARRQAIITRRGALIELRRLETSARRHQR